MIVETASGRQVDLRFQMSDLPARMLRAVSGTPVSPAAVAGIPALHRAVRLKAEQLAKLRLTCRVGLAPQDEPAPSVWQARFFQARPNPVQTRFGFWETVGESLGWRNNAYAWLNIDPASRRLVEWWALHPDQVVVKDDGYHVTVAPGYIDPVGKGRGRYVVGADTILHFRGHGAGGTLVAPDPIQVFRDALAIPLQRQRREAQMWAKGSNVQLAIELPAEINQPAADRLRTMWRETYDHADGETTAVLGGGGTVKTIGMTMEQAQWVESANLTISDASRITGVPAALLGVVGENHPPLEQVRAEWLEFGLSSDVERLESHLESHPALFPTGTRPRPRFETTGVVRGDLKTEAEIEHMQIQDGSLLIDEARERRGMPPLPDGVGQIPQVIPVGGSPVGVPIPDQPAA